MLYAKPLYPAKFLLTSDRCCYLMIIDTYCNAQLVINCHNFALREWQARLSTTAGRRRKLLWSFAVFANVVSNVHKRWRSEDCADEILFTRSRWRPCFVTALNFGEGCSCVVSGKFDDGSCDCFVHSLFTQRNSSVPCLIS